MTTGNAIEAEVIKLATTDGGHGILASEMVEQALERLLMARLNLSNENAEALFSGPLRGFLQKMSLAKDLGLVTKSPDLHVVRSVRNAFAHPRGWWHFSSPEVIAKLQKSSAWKEGIDPKTFFYERVSAAINALNHDIDAEIARQLMPQAEETDPG